MPAYISSNANRFYCATEAIYGQVPPITSDNRIPAVKLVRQATARSDQPEGQDRESNVRWIAAWRAAPNHIPAQHAANNLGWRSELAELWTAISSRAGQWRTDLRWGDGCRRFEQLYVGVCGTSRPHCGSSYCLSWRDQVCNCSRRYSHGPAERSTLGNANTRFKHQPDSHLLSQHRPSYGDRVRLLGPKFRGPTYPMWSSSRSDER